MLLQKFFKFVARPECAHFDIRFAPAREAGNFCDRAFLEVQQQPNEQTPLGLNHWGLETQEIKSTVATFRERGLTVSDPGAPSAFTGGILANVNDPVYGRIELSEQPPDGKLRKASEAWKP